MLDRAHVRAHGVDTGGAMPLEEDGMTNQSGTIGDRECDGWVLWTTCDDGNSYNPTLSCGHFEIVIGKGTMWGAPSDGHGRATVVIYSGDASELGTEDGETFDFEWCGGEFCDVMATIAGNMDHPVPLNVIAAAHELWTALLFRDAERGEAIPPSPYPDCMSKVDHDRHMRNNRGSVGGDDLVTMKVR
jgi:hypothetical protein